MTGTVENTFGIDIIPENDEQRLEALRRYNLLDTPPEEAFANLANLIANYFDVPIALISLVDRSRVQFKGNVGMAGVKNVSRGTSLCSLAVLSDKPTIIEKPLEDPCLLANPMVHGTFGLRFYAGAPIITPDGFNIGTVCIVDKKERKFSEKEKDQLVRFSKVVMQQIEQRLAALQLVNYHQMEAAELEQRVQERTRELEEANLQLKKTNADLEQITYVSHHDLQEPIRKILLFSDMIGSDSGNLLTNTSNIQLTKINDAAHRMSRALQDVLNYASLQKEEQMVQVDLNKVMSDVVIDLEVVIAEKKATLSVSPLPVIRAIPQQMHQLFYNLISNALKFSKKELVPVISIQTQRIHAKNSVLPADAKPGIHYHQITVQDNGIGFKQQHAEKIFMMFQRLHNKTDYAGTGIGLAMVKKVVDNHNGFITAEGKDGEGALFRVLLPSQ